ncbi:hypothetical protein BX283_7673 [Streptomyces sp. TLI_146]|nr:hypothetical protein BX283_7673 [Streptomyces sp. TLI_146]
MTALPLGLLPPGTFPRLEPVRVRHVMWAGLLDERITAVRRWETEERRAQERRPPPAKAAS